MSNSLFQDEIILTSDGIQADLIARDLLDPNALRTAGGSTRAMGGAGVLGEDFRKFAYDSGLELRSTLELIADPEVLIIRPQAVATKYLDEDGTERTTYWDILVIRRDGRRELISVKSLAVAKTSAFQDHWKRVCAGIGPGIAHTARLVTEACIDPEKVDLGLLYNKALAGGRPRQAEAAHFFLASQTEPVTVEAVCQYLREQNPAHEALHFEVHSVAFWSVVWLLAKRAARQCNGGFLTVDSLVELA